MVLAKKGREVRLLMDIVKSDVGFVKGWISLYLERTERAGDARFRGVACKIAAGDCS